MERFPTEIKPPLHIYGRTMADWVPNYPIDKTQQINLLIPLFSSPPTSMLFIPWSTTKDGALGLPTNLGQPAISLPWRGPSWVRALVVPLLVCLDTSRFFVMQARWLSFGGLLINLSVFHHVRVTFSLRSSVCGGPGVQCPCWCVIWTTSNVNTLFGDSAGEEFASALLCSRFFLA
jgi:hypothetical protein